jgi:glyoxylase-like metal-dependent hydrolase (beta-lactamase superfamily II)
VSETRGPAVVCITNGQFAQNCYLVADTAVGECAIVDPGEESGRILAEVARRGWRVTGIWLTHAHVDHILGVAAVKAATGAPIYLHAADRPLYDGLPQQAQWMGLTAMPAPPPDAELRDGDRVRVGTHEFEVRHTPGHSPGAVSFIAPGVALTGDALFAGSVGRTDLPGGDGAALLRSIRSRLLPLPDDTVVHSGHGPATTIGEERAANPFLTGAYELA